MAVERLLLVGMMGVGKTTVGRMVARRLGWLFVDSDKWVEDQSGQSVKALFASSGEAGFREVETRALQQIVSGTVPVVVAVAGGAVLDPGSRALLQDSGTVVWLRAKPVTLTNRVGSGAGRPLLSDGDPGVALASLDAFRRPLYEEVSDATVDVDDLSAEQVMGQVLAAMRALQPAEEST